MEILTRSVKTFTADSSKLNCRKHHKIYGKQEKKAYAYEMSLNAHLHSINIPRREWVSEWAREKTTTTTPTCIHFISFAHIWLIAATTHRDLIWSIVPRAIVVLQVCVCARAHAATCIISTDHITNLLCLKEEAFFLFIQKNYKPNGMEAEMNHCHCRHYYSYQKAKSQQFIFELSAIPWYNK